MKRLSPLPQAPASHSLLTAACQGYWWCRACRKVIDTVLEWDRFDQEQYPACEHCGSRNIKRHGAVL